MIIELDAPVVDFSVYPKRVEVVPERIVFHPRFSVGEIRHDLALVRFTPPPAIVTKRVPACLSSANDAFLESNATTTLAALFFFVPRLRTGNTTAPSGFSRGISERLNLGAQNSFDKRRYRYGSFNLLIFVLIFLVEPDRNETIVSTPRRVRILNASSCRVGAAYNPAPEETICGEQGLCEVTS